jgi:hypothetical protein
MYQKLKYKPLGILLGAGVLSMVSMLASAQNLYMNDLKLKSELDWLNAQGVTQISTSNVGCLLPILRKRRLQPRNKYYNQCILCLIKALYPL